MEAFCHLFHALDATPATEAKVALLAAFLQTCTPAEGAWALQVLLGRQSRRLITGRRLREICLSGSSWPAWLFDDCHRQVGDSAETISLLWTVDPGSPPGLLQGSLQHWMEERLPSLAALQGEEQADAVRDCWRELPPEQLLVVNKLLTGGLRVGVSEGLVIRALSRFCGVEEASLKHRLMGGFQPTEWAWQQLISTTEADQVPASRPYPFFLASPLEEGFLQTTPVSQWQVEWKYDGIRCQLIHRRGEVFLWSRGEDLINPSFPDLSAAAALLPEGLVLDGEVVIWPPGEAHPRPFAALQRRLGRRAPGRRILQEAPACYVIYDLLERAGVDLRSQPLQERRLLLEDHLGNDPPPSLRLAPVLPLNSWDDLEPLRSRAREAGAEGLMLKHRAAPYLSGRRRGHWWKHKLEPFRLDAVLVYAQAGSGRRANLYTDYTFALWDRPWREPGETQLDPPKLVTFAKAYSGLDDRDIQRLDQWIRTHTIQRFGPVRAVEPELVFELAFEGIQPSSRHKSGVAVRFPRISRWRSDKGPREANSVEEALTLMAPAPEVRLTR
jgi:DNA ligase-1